VRIAAQCLWVSAALTTIMAAIQIPQLLILVRVGAVKPIQFAVGLLGVAVLVALLLFVAAKVRAGRGWVRWLTLGLWVIGVAVSTLAAIRNPGAFFAQTPLNAIVEAFQWVLQTLFLVLVFLQPSREWFARRR
jgi:hypothetical protein